MDSLLALAMMVKDEAARVTVSLQSCIDIVDKVIILDTGSADGTQKVIKDFCRIHGKPCLMKESTFVDFSTSRNELLAFAENQAEFLLLLDSNDELQNAENLREFLEPRLDQDHEEGFLVNQCLYSGPAEVLDFYNVRVIRNNRGWRYQGVVHEYLCNGDKRITERIPEIRLYQDRTADDGRTQARFPRDEELLLAEYWRNPHDPRTVFYLAQTYLCMRDHERGLKYYKIRSGMSGFHEETYEALLQCGVCAQAQELDWETDVFPWYYQAWRHSHRAEPLVKIAEYYRDKDWDTAYMFLRQACDLPYPSTAILFVDKYIYDYYRWHLMGIVACYTTPKRLSDGRKACELALRYNPDSEVDRFNYQFYQEDA